MLTVPQWLAHCRKFIEKCPTLHSHEITENNLSSSLPTSCSNVRSLLSCPQQRFYPRSVLLVPWRLRTARILEACNTEWDVISAHVYLHIFASCPITRLTHCCNAGPTLPSRARGSLHIWNGTYWIHSFIHRDFSNHPEQDAGCYGASSHDIYTTDLALPPSDLLRLAVNCSPSLLHFRFLANIEHSGCYALYRCQ